MYVFQYYNKIGVVSFAIRQLLLPGKKSSVSSVVGPSGPQDLSKHGSDEVKFLLSPNSKVSRQALGEFLLVLNV
jgi:hypothetical protein